MEHGTVVLSDRVTLLICITLLFTISLGILVLALPLYVTSLGGSATQWGLLSGAFACSMVFAETGWGWVSDRIGVIVPFAVSRAGATLLSAVFALTGHMGALLAVQLARGAVEVGMGPTTRKALASSLGSARKGLGMGLFQACHSLGGALGALIGGYMVGRWGYPPTFALASGISLVSFMIVILSREKLGGDSSTLGPAPVQVRADAPNSAVLVQRNNSPGPFAVLCLVGVFLFLGYGAARAFVPLLGSSVAGLPPSQIAFLLTISGTVSGLLMVFMGRLSDRLGRRRLIVGGLALVGISLLIYGFSTDFVSLAMATLVQSVGYSAAAPAAVALASDFAPQSREGQMLGLYGSSENVGVMLGPLLCGFLWDAHSPRFAFVVCAVLLAMGTALGIIALRQQEG